MMRSLLTRRNLDALGTTRSPLDTLGEMSLAIPGGGGMGGDIIAEGPAGDGVDTDSVGKVLILTGGTWNLCEVETISTPSGSVEATDNTLAPFGIHVGMVGAGNARVLIHGRREFEGTPGAAWFVGKDASPVTTPPFTETSPTNAMAFNRFLGWQIDDATMAVMPWYQPWLRCRTVVCVDGETGPVALMRLPL